MKKTILFLDDNDINEMEWLKAAAANSAFDFLNDVEENIYSLQDGKPFYFQISVDNNDKISKKCPTDS